MMKKILIIFAFTVVLTAFGILAYFLVAPASTQTIENKPPENASSAELKSFKGCLADILEEAVQEVKEIKEEITEAMPNPFAESAPSADNSFSFAVIGDTQRFTAGNRRGNFQKVAANIQQQNPDLVISVGDLIANCRGESDRKDYNNWKNVLGTLSSKTYAVQGNHDRVESVDKCDRIWTDTFTFPTNGPEGFAEFAYSLDFKNSHFVFLDSDKPDQHRINSTQREWLEQDLAKNTKENVFVVFHEPAYPVSDKGTEGLDANPSERNDLWRILDQHNVTAVFNGHEHIVSRRKINSAIFKEAKNEVYQFVFGSTDSFDHGLPAAGVAEYANQGQGRFGLVKVAGQEITVETLGPDGSLLNTFTFSK